MKCLFTQLRKPTPRASQQYDFSGSLKAFSISNTGFETLRVFSLMRRQKQCLYHRRFNDKF
jgi:hypothetical protein